MQTCDASVPSQKWSYGNDNHLAITGGTQCLDSAGREFSNLNTTQVGPPALHVFLLLMSLCSAVRRTRRPGSSPCPTPPPARSKSIQMVTQTPCAPAFHLHMSGLTTRTVQCLVASSLKYGASVKHGPCDQGVMSSWFISNGTNKNGISPAGAGGLCLNVAQCTHMVLPILRRY
jgi:hypothetical protein